MISKRWTIATALSVLLISTLMVPPVQSRGLRLKKLLIGYVIAKAIKPRFVPIPLPLPFPLKIGKDKHVSYPVYSHSTSAHAEMVHDPWQGAGGYGGGGGGGGGGYGGGGGGGGMGGGWY